MHNEPIPADLTGRTVMTIWAHPDDEAYLSAGFMAAAADAGARVVVVAATLGEQGTPDPVLWPPERMAELRRREFAAAADQVGAARLEVLGYADGGCAEVDPTDGRGAVASLLVRHRPDVVVTFGVDGVTGHADHRAVNGWVDSAVALVDRRIGLLHAAMAQVMPDHLIDAFDRAGAFEPGYPRADFAVPARCLRVRGDLLRRKVAALDAHASQTAGLRSFVGDERYVEQASYEGFRPANAAALPWLDRMVPHRAPHTELAA